MLDFLFQYRYIIIMIFIVVGFLIIFSWEKFKSTAYALMLQAKRLAKDTILSSGAEQEEWVINKAYQFLPRAITMLISRELMKTIVHKLYISAKDYLDNGKMDGSIK